MSFWRRGFSLVELLVVIAIMGTLITLLLPNFVNVRQKGQDSRRKLDLEQIRSALEQYRSVNGYYPTSLNTLTAPTVYISRLPTDPTTSSSYQFTALPAGCDNATTSCTDYVIGALLSSTSSCTTTPTSNCSGTTACNYCLGPYGAK